MNGTCRYAHEHGTRRVCTLHGLRHTTPLKRAPPKKRISTRKEHESSVLSDTPRICRARLSGDVDTLHRVELQHAHRGLKHGKIRRLVAVGRTEVAANWLPPIRNGRPHGTPYHTLPPGGLVSTVGGRHITEGLPCEQQGRVGKQKYRWHGPPR